MPPDDSAGKPVRWVMVSGYLTGLLTLAFFMVLTILRALGIVEEIEAFLVPPVLGIGLALSFGFIGGGAAAAGKLPLGVGNKYPLSFSVGGGMAVFVISTLIVHSVMPSLPHVSPGPRRMTPDTLDLRFTVQSLPRVTIGFIQWKPRWEPLYHLARQDEFYEREDVPFPSAAQEYRATFKPIVEDSSLMDSVPEEYEICFRRRPQGLAVGHSGFYAMLTCPDTKLCIVDDSKDPGWIVGCHASRSAWWPSSIVAAAHAQSAALGWSVPSLETLRRLSSAHDSRSPGYTEFRIKTKPLNGVTDADAITYGIRVNDLPVYVDGWSPDDLRVPFDGSRGLDIEFGLQNLGFSGSQGGFEKIEVAVYFLRRGKRVAPPLILSRLYAACTTDGKEIARSGPVEVSWPLGEGIEASWTAQYVAPPVQDRFEVIVRSSTDPSEIQQTKWKIDTARLEVHMQRLVGVVRPPLDGNPYFAVMVGLQRENGQIQFTFSEDLANEVCRWTHENRHKFSGAVRADTFRMENALPYDHPERRIRCSRL